MAIKKYYVTVDEESTTRWYKDAKCKILHRENGPAVEYTTGDNAWYQNGQCHRTDGPAIEWSDGTKSWYQNGKRHRIDGAAIEYSGDKAWYINGEELTEEEFIAATQPAIEMTVADIEKLVGKHVKIIK